MKKTILFKLIILIIILSINYSTVSFGQTATDSTGISSPTAIELTDINYEIEQTEKKLKAQNAHPTFYTAAAKHQNAFVEVKFSF